MVIVVFMIKITTGSGPVKPKTCELHFQACEIKDGDGEVAWASGQWA